MKDLRQAVGTELEGHEEAAGLIGHSLTHEAPPPPQSEPSAGTNRSQTPSSTERLVEDADGRLTAEDGYQAERTYSIASAPDEDVRAERFGITGG